MRKILSFALILALVVGSYFFGIYSHKKKTAFYMAARELGSYFKEAQGYYDNIPRLIRKTDVTQLIDIETSGDIDVIRKRFIYFVWGSVSLPTRKPKTIKMGVVDEFYSDLDALKNIDIVRVDMELGFESLVYVFKPKKPNKRVLIFHQGHSGDFDRSKSRISKFLQHGFTVVALNMPLVGKNNKPAVNVAGIGWIQMTSHDRMKFAKPKSGHPVKFFLEPVVLMINQLESQFDDFSMVGLSGGGWTTTLVAAIDPRIKSSFPVAGSYPLFLAAVGKNDWGHWELTIPELYSIANYLELYVMGSSGPGRRQLQVLNKFDLCCFNGSGWRLYRNAVHDRVKIVGETGSFDIFVDESHRGHKISNVAVTKILEELERGATRWSR